MESISESTATTEFVTAEELRDMTISKEDRFERDRGNIMNSLMDSMVKIASENGLFVYTANLNPQFDAVLLTTISKDLNELGYEVTAEEKDEPNLGKFISLNVSWEVKNNPTVAPVSN